MARIDRLWRDSVVVAAFGPVQVPDRSSAMAAFAALAACGPDARVGLRFCPDSHNHWLYRSDDLAEYAESCVTQLEPGADEDVDVLMNRLAVEYDSTVATRIFLADHHVLAMVSHAVGDSRLIVSIPPAIVAHVAHGTPPSWTAPGSDPHPLRSALRHTFTRPAATTALLAERRDTRATGATGATGAAAPCRNRDGDCDGIAFRPDPVAVSVPGAAGGTRAARAWTSRNMPGAAHFATILTMVEQALTEQGIACSPGVHMVFDLRRYLPRGRRTLGNFVGGLDLPTPVQDPVRITEVVTRAAKVGRPLAAVVMATALSALSRVPGFRARPEVRVASHPSAQLALSYIRPVRVDDELPWTGPTEQRMYWCRVEPVEPTAITLLVGMIGTRLQLSASFHANVFEPASVRAALQAVQDDPIGLLQRASARRAVTASATP